MGLTSTSWKEGQSPNPNGRPNGSRNRRNAELWDRLAQRGDLDPAEFLSSIVTNTSEPKDQRIAAAGLLLPYKYAKATAPTPVVFIEQTLNINRPTTIRQARDNIAHISELKATSQIDMAWGDNLIADQTTLLNSMIDEAKLIAADGGDQPKVIRIEGGLPRLPGTSITMPSDPPYQPGFQDPANPPDPPKANGSDQPEAPPEIPV
jgi:hypothetical protein